MIAGGVAGGALVIGGGAAVLRGRSLHRYRPPLATGQHAFGPWIKISTDGAVTLMDARSEMGQGVQSMMAIIVAEELGADFSRMRLEAAPVANVYRNVVAVVSMLPFAVPPEGAVRRAAEELALQLGMMATGGSTSTIDAWAQLRSVAAAAREMLIAAAATRWNVAPESCRTDRGFVLDASGHSLGFGELAAVAATLDPPEQITLKDPAAFSLIGKSPPRIDVPAKVNGVARFGIDVRLPGLRYAAIRHAPQFGARVVPPPGGFKDVDDVKFVHLGHAVVAVADSYWIAQRALNALDLKFEGGSDASNASLMKQFEAALDAGKDLKYFEGDASTVALDSGGQTIKAEYRLPLLAHACMEPMNSTALFKDGTLELWSGSQAQTPARDNSAAACGIASDKVIFHTTLLGGGFGRRAETDFTVLAARVAYALPGTPIQLIWSREEDIQHDVYRPAALARYEATLGGSGAVTRWSARSAMPSVLGDFLARNAPLMADSGVDKLSVEGAVRLPYELGARQVAVARVNTAVPVGNWRSVGYSVNSFFVESFIDELAIAAGKDPLSFRLGLLGKSPRHMAVLEKVAAMANWGRDTAGRYQGVALVESFGSIVAEVIEISMPSPTEPKIERVWAALDCGLAIDPRNVKAQLRSAIIYGLTAALWGEVRIENGRTTSANFSDTRMMTLADAPRIEVELVSQGSSMGGVGEIGVPPVFAALSGAVFKATGKRIRELPLVPQLQKA
jgi:isoquinoline 1-oxidoreductase beta subunit